MACLIGWHLVAAGIVGEARSAFAYMGACWVLLLLVSSGEGGKTRWNPVAGWKHKVFSDTRQVCARRTTRGEGSGNGEGCLTESSGSTPGWGIESAFSSDGLGHGQGVLDKWMGRCNSEDIGSLQAELILLFGEYYFPHLASEVIKGREGDENIPGG